MKSKKAIILIIICIVFVGCLFRFIVFERYRHNFKIQGDAFNYQTMSIQLVDKGIYGYGFGERSFVSNAFVTPGYPLFLSLVYFLFHNPEKQVLVVRFIQAIISGAFIPLLSFFLVLRVSKKRGIALLTTFFVAIYPTYIFSTAFLLTEVFSLFSMLLYLYFFVLAVQKKSLLLYFFSGAAFAVQILIRPTMLPLFIIPFVFMFFTFYKTKRSQLIKLYIFKLCGFLLLMLPWWIRNFIVLHQIVITATGSGNPLLAGTYPYKQGYFKDVNHDIMKSSKAQTKFALKRIIKGFTSNPLLYIKWYTIGKAEAMFGLPWLDKLEIIFRNFYIILQGAFICLGSFDVILGSIFNKTKRFVYIYALLFLGLYLIFVPETRYAYQLMFFMIFAFSNVLYYIFGYIHKIYSKIN